MDIKNKTLKFSQLRGYTEMEDVPELKELYDWMLVNRHQGKSSDMVNQFSNFTYMMEAGYQINSNVHRCGIGIMHQLANGEWVIYMLDGQHRALLRVYMLNGWRKVHGDNKVIDLELGIYDHYHRTWFHDGVTFDLSMLDFPTNVITMENFRANKDDLAEYLESKYTYLRVVCG